MSKLMLSVFLSSMLQVLGIIFTYYRIDSGVPTGELFQLALRVLLTQQLYGTLFNSLLVLYLLEHGSHLKRQRDILQQGLDKLIEGPKRTIDFRKPKK